MPAFLLVDLFVNPIGSNRFQINLGLHMKIGDADNMAIQVLCNLMGVGCVRISKDQYYYYDYYYYYLLNMHSKEHCT